MPKISKHGGASNAATHQARERPAWLATEPEVRLPRKGTAPQDTDPTMRRGRRKPTKKSVGGRSTAGITRDDIKE